MFRIVDPPAVRSLPSNVIGERRLRAARAESRRSVDRRGRDERQARALLYARSGDVLALPAGRRDGR